MPELSSHGVAIHAITAQPGDVRAKLAEENVFVDFPIYSDPEGELVVPEGCIFGEVDQSREYFTKDQKKEYMPALFVTDAKGNVTTWWSWKKFSSAVLDRVGAMDTDPTITNEYDAGLVVVDVGELGVKASADSEKKDNKKTWIINIRPQASKMVEAILEGKAFELEEALSTDETLEAHLKSTGGNVPYNIPAGHSAPATDSKPDNRIVAVEKKAPKTVDVAGEKGGVCEACLVQ